jgi:RNA polymerase sigma factor (sigma-70 family)
MSVARTARPPFQAFLDQHRAPVLAFLCAMVGPVEADDCFQETFLAALRAYDRFDGRNPRAWVLTIARRKALDHHRARARGPEPRSELPERAVVDEGNHQAPELWLAVSALPPKQRAAIALRFASDLPYRDLARALDSSEEAARQNVHEGLKSLRAAMHTKGGDE